MKLFINVICNFEWLFKGAYEGLSPSCTHIYLKFSSLAYVLTDLFSTKFHLDTFWIYECDVKLKPWTPSLSLGHAVTSHWMILSENTQPRKKITAIISQFLVLLLYWSAAIVLFWFATILQFVLSPYKKWKYNFSNIKTVSLYPLAGILITKICTIATFGQ